MVPDRHTVLSKSKTHVAGGAIRGVKIINSDTINVMSG